MTSISTARTAPPEPAEIPVWDLPTRLFHWSLFALVVMCWLTGESESNATLHRVSGELIAGLLIFRVLWGFFGGARARFADFVRSPQVIGEHIANLMRGKVAPTAGHNPLGGLNILLMLAALAAVVVTGLLSSGEEGPSGPFAGMVAWNAKEAHEAAFVALELLVLVHLAGVAVSSYFSRDRLVLAMITGTKRRRVGETVRRTASAPLAAFLVVFAISAGSSTYLIQLPHPNAPRGEQSTQTERQPSQATPGEVDDD